jgi:hypothetical protein
MYQQLWGYKVEEKLYLGVREQKRLNTTDLDYCPVPKWIKLSLDFKKHDKHFRNLN